MNSLELTEHRMLVAMVIDSHRPDRRYMSRKDFAEYHVEVEPALFRSIVLDLREQGVAKAVPTLGSYAVRLHANGHKEALARILKALDADTFTVDWDTKRIMHDALADDHDSLVPSPDMWMLMEMDSKRKPPAVVGEHHAGKNFLAHAAHAAAVSKSNEGPWTKVGVIITALSLLAAIIIAFVGI